MAAPVPAAPTPFPEGDPRNAKYFENVAALEHTLKNTLAGDAAQRASAQSGYDYSTGQLDRQLPLTMQATRNTANQQGLLESGQLAQRSGTVEGRYAAQRGRLTSGLQQTEGRIDQNDRSATEAFQLGRTRAASSAREEGLRQLEQESPNEQQPATAAAPAAPAAPQLPQVVSQHFQPVSRGAPLRPRRAAQPHARRQAVKRALTGGTGVG